MVLIEPPHISGTAANADGHAADRWRSAFGDVEPSVVLEGYARQGEVLRRVAVETGSTHLPTSAFGLDSLRFYEPGDPIHLVDEGTRVLADGLAGALRPLLQPAPVALAP